MNKNNTKYDEKLYAQTYICSLSEAIQTPQITLSYNH